MSDRYFGYEAPTGIDHPVATYPPDPATLQAADDASGRTTFAMNSDGDATLPRPHIVEYWEMVRHDDHEKVYGLAQAWKRMSELFGITGDTLYEKASWLAARWSSPHARDEFLRRVGAAIKSFDEWRDVAYANYSRLYTFAAQLERTRGTVYQQYLSFAEQYNKVFNPAGPTDPIPGVREPLVKATGAARPAMVELADTAAETTPRYDAPRYRGPLDAKQPRHSAGGAPTPPRRPTPPPPPPTTELAHPGAPVVTQPVGPPPSPPGTDPGPILAGRSAMPAAPPTATPAPAAPPPSAPPAGGVGVPAPPPGAAIGAPAAPGTPPGNAARPGTPPAPPPGMRSAPPRVRGRANGDRPPTTTPPTLKRRSFGTRPPVPGVISPRSVSRTTGTSPTAAGSPFEAPPPGRRGTPPVIAGGRGRPSLTPRSEPGPAITRPAEPPTVPERPRPAGVSPRLEGRTGTVRVATEPPEVTGNGGNGPAESNLLGRTGRSGEPDVPAPPPALRPSPRTAPEEGEELWHPDTSPGPAVIDPATTARPPVAERAHGTT